MTSHYYNYDNYASKVIITVSHCIRYIYIYIYIF